ncbi:MAG: O-antigen ligase family protein, partial [Candidatus Omnitrophica bacterium]|nr:O-antigen ligase family protein [Candidatus Omnitrophota bacterium]
VFWLPYSMAVMEWAVGLSLATFIAKRVYLFRKKRDIGWLHIFQPLPNPLNKPLAAFLLVCFISVFMSDRIQDSFESFFTKTAEPFIIYVLFLEAFRTLKQVKVLLTVIVVTALGTGIDALVQFHITGEDIFLSRPLSKGPRATAGFNAPTGLGAYLVMSLPLITGFFMSKPAVSVRRSIGMAAALGCLAYALFLTFSRGAWLSLALGTIVVLTVYMLVRRYSRKQVVVFLTASTLVCGMLLSYYLGNIEKFSSLNRGVLSWRIDVWKQTVDMIKEKPLFGYGVNTYMRKFHAYRYDRRNIPQYKRHPATYAHNCYLQIAMETGLAGLAAFMWILFAYYRFVLSRIRETYHRHRERGILVFGLMTGITGFFIHAFFDTHFYSLPLAGYLWSMMAVACFLLTPTATGKGPDNA